MIDLLFQVGLSNTCFAMLVVLAAVITGAKCRRPHLAHVLWILVFVKLLTPPLLTLPVEPFADISQTAATSPGIEAAASESGRMRVLDREPVVSAEIRTVPIFVSNGALIWAGAQFWIAAVWISGSVIILVGSLFRVFRFHRLLLSESVRVSDEVQTVARSLSANLELKFLPEILQTSAAVSPLVWWIGGTVRIVLPKAVLDGLSPEEWRWVLAHELAHVRRRDYLVRWLEWLASVCFWWNPVIWWAQKELRATEEVCCDALVLSSFRPKPRVYATSIFKAVEILAVPSFRPPAMASEINSGGYLERRVKMILSNSTNKKAPSWLRSLAIASAVAIMPMGIATADDGGYAAVARRLAKSVKKGDITEAQADRMMEVLKNMSSEKKSREHAEHEERREIRREKDSDGAEGADVRARWQELRKRLGQAVKDGKLTREEAAEKMRALREEREDDGADKQRADLRAKWEAVQSRIEAAVEAGKLSEEDAKAKLLALRERIGRAWENESEHEGKKKKPEHRKDTDAGKHKSKEKGKDNASEHSGTSGMEKRLANLRQRLGEAVESGKLTGEEAEEKWNMATRRAKAGGEKLKKELEGLGDRLKAAVKAGKITEEEAKEKWEAIRKKAGL